MEKNYVNQLFFQTTHGSTIGRYREKILEEMFESIVPKKFVIEQSVFIIDSKGNVSNEVDLAILMRCIHRMFSDMEKLSLSRLRQWWQ